MSLLRGAHAVRTLPQGANFPGWGNLPRNQKMRAFFLPQWGSGLRGARAVQGGGGGGKHLETAVFFFRCRVCCCYAVRTRCVHSPSVTFFSGFTKDCARRWAKRNQGWRQGANFPGWGNLPRNRKMRAFFLPQSPFPLATLPRGGPMAGSDSVVLRIGVVSHPVRTVPYRVSHPGRTSNSPTRTLTLPPSYQSNHFGRMALKL